MELTTRSNCWHVEKELFAIIFDTENFPSDFLKNVSAISFKFFKNPMI